ncbi:MAG TPA: metallophosphoesterase family protein [Acidimicrobiales bacterium]|nr:metallophosphoesterase family protein [Acidimicrobiales bacterium]
MLDLGFFYDDASAAPDPGITTIPLPATTAPEQLHLQWGSDPARSVTVSWAAPGTIAQPAPKLFYSKAPISEENPGRVIGLPPPAPLDVTRPRPPAAAISFTDGLSGFTTYHYHVQLTDLELDTTYHYQVTDGGATPSFVGSSFTTAPVGRARYRFTSYGDMGTPTSSSTVNVTGFDWVEGNDTCVFEVDAVETPGDGRGAPLFHLLNGDLCYGNLDPANTPSVWRDFGVNVARSAANRPWMPTIGNHENEFGISDRAGRPFPGPIAKAGAAGSYWNGPYGDGHYLSRFTLPDNGVRNHDGNRLQGNFYKFQVGTVLFVALDNDDVIYQQNDNAGPGAGNTYRSGASIPAGLLVDSREYTGGFEYNPDDNSLVPAAHHGNVQLTWLEQTLAEGRRDPSVEMIVVFMHQPALGGTPDLGIRQTWAPLFDRYTVDLVLQGHAHLYERCYPVRGYDPDAGTVTTAFNGYEVGDPFDTRRPTTVTTQPAMVDGTPAWNTAEGTVYLVLGGGGASSSLPYSFDPADGERDSLIITNYNGETNAVEDAPWSAGRDAGDAHGYAVFDVDPGEHHGETTITFSWFPIPTVADGQIIELPTTPLETHIFGRRVPVVRSGEPHGKERGNKPRRHLVG